MMKIKFAYMYVIITHNTGVSKREKLMTKFNFEHLLCIGIKPEPDHQMKPNEVFISTNTGCPNKNLTLIAPPFLSPP